VVFVSQETPLRPLITQALKENKTVVVGVKKPHSAFQGPWSGPSHMFVTMSDVPSHDLQLANSDVGIARFGYPLELDASIAIDLVVVGSVAVSPKHGARLGKGDGRDDKLWGAMRWMGWVSAETPVVTVVHECQLDDSLSSSDMGPGDLAVDVIATPERVLMVEGVPQKPSEVAWSDLRPDQLGQAAFMAQQRGPGRRTAT